MEKGIKNPVYNLKVVSLDGYVEDVGEHTTENFFEDISNSLAIGYNDAREHLRNISDFNFADWLSSSFSTSSGKDAKEAYKTFNNMTEDKFKDIVNNNIYVPIGFDVRLSNVLEYVVKTEEVTMRTQSLLTEFESEIDKIISNKDYRKDAKGPLKDLEIKSKGVINKEITDIDSGLSLALGTGTETTIGNLAPTLEDMQKSVTEIFKLSKTIKETDAKFLLKSTSNLSKRIDALDILVGRGDIPKDVLKHVDALIFLFANFVTVSGKLIHTHFELINTIHIASTEA